MYQAAHNTRMKNQHTGGIALILSAAVLWGTTGTAQSFAPLALSSYWVGASRLLVSGVFFLSWILLTDYSACTKERLKTMPWPLILSAALSMAAYNLTFFAGVRATSVGIGTAVALGSSPIWAGILQAIWFRELPTTSWWVAVSIALSGLLITTYASFDIAITSSVIGIGLCLLSGLSYAAYALLTKELVYRVSATVSTAWVFSCAAIFAAPAAFFLAGTPVFNSSDLAVVLWLGVIATGIAYLLFSKGIRFVSSATGVALALAEPIAAVVLAMVVIGERPGTIPLTGMVIVFIGLCLIVRAELKAAKGAKKI